MKIKTTVFIITMLCIVELHAQTTHVPDNNFEQALIDQGYDDVLDDYVLTSNISGLISLNISSRGISDLSGIQDFVALNYLYCHDNQLTSLDVTHNTGLIQLFCYQNKLTNLDVRNNTALDVLYCHFNQIGSLDVSKNIVMTNLSCAYNNIQTLNLSNNTSLERLNCSDNQLTTLDLTLNTALTALTCRRNQLTDLNVRNGYNILLTSFNATNNPLLACIQADNEADANAGIFPYNNWQKDATTGYSEDCEHFGQTWVPDDNFEQALIVLGYDEVLDDYVITANISGITSLDISSNNIVDLTGIEDFVSLTGLYCQDNQLTSLDVRQNIALVSLDCSSNQLTSLDVRNRNNLAITTFNATGNPLLTCIGVDNEADANAGLPPYDSWLKDATTGYSEDCSNSGITFVPDNNFEMALINLGFDDVLDDYVVTANISGITSLDISSKNIVELTGIEDFVSLTALNCQDNLLTSLDVSQNTALTHLYCRNNQLTSLELGPNTVLTYVSCENNQLTSLDISQNTALTWLICRYNELTGIDASNNLALLELNGHHNKLTSIDLGPNTTLSYLYCESNQLTSIDVTQNTGLIQLMCNSNQLTSLDVRNNTALDILYCHFNQIGSLDVSQNTAMTYLSCAYNNIQTLSLISNTSLERLACNENQITELDLRLNTALTQLSCNNNQLTSLNVRSGYNAYLTSFNATNNPLLACVQADNEADANAGIFPYNNWRKDATTAYSEDCEHFGQTWVPDDNFEQALIVLGYDEVLDDYVNTANISGITSLDISSKNIVDLTGIEDFVSLTALNCQNNLLTGLDVRQNIALVSLDCSSNQLTSLDVRNRNNPAITTFNATGNPLLTCIGVDNEADANAGLTPYDSWLKDATTGYSEDCSNSGITFVPDNNFEMALINLGFDDVLDDYVVTANISGITSLDISSKNIVELTGIEDFVSLTALNCQDNLLTSLDVSQNTALTHLYCRNNQLTSLELGPNTVLTYVSCENNQLTSLDISQNTALTWLICRYNELTGIDASNNLALLELNGHHNKLTSIDLGPNTTLSYLYCGSNQLTSIDVTQNTGLIQLMCNSNQLTSLDVSQNTSLDILHCHFNPLNCIQVENEADANAGLPPYNSWQKDATASYSGNCQPNFVSGVVTNEAGEPLEGIQVLVKSVSDTGPFTVGTDYVSVGATLSDGTYEVNQLGLPSGTYDDVKVYFYDATAMYVAEGYDNIMFTNQTEQQVWDLSIPVARGSTDVNAVLTKNAVSGVVTDEAGVPLEGIQVLVRAVSDTGPFTAGNLVESVGATLPDGSYEVSLDAMGFAFGYEDVKVYFYDATAMYVAEGYDNIMFTNLTEQQVWDLSNPVARGSTTVDAVLTKNAVSGVVTDEAGVPLEGIQVLVRAVSDTGPFTAGNLVESVGATLPDGSYEVSLDAMGFAFGYEDVKVYFYDATAMYVAEGYDNIMFTNLTEQQVWDLSIPVARGSTDVNAVLTKNAVSGVVTDEAGVPLEGIQVLVRAVSDTGPFTAGNLVESVGATLPDGSYEVSLDAMGFAFGYEDVKVYFYDLNGEYVAEGYDNIMFTNQTEQQVWDLSNPVARGSTDVNAVLTKNAVSGVVTDEAGVPLEGIQVLVRAVSDTGPFTAGNLVESVGATLPDGSYEVSLDAMGFAFGYEDVKVYFYDATAMYVAEGYDNIMFTNLTEQQVWDLSIPVARGSTDVNAVLTKNAVSGVVTDEAGVSLEGIQVLVRAVSDTGPFTAGNLVESVGATLPDGSYEVSLDAMGFAFGYEDVKVYFYDATAMYVAEGYDNIMFTNLTEQQVWDLSIPVARGSTTVDAVLTKNAVSGVVTDEAGVPLEGIQVLVRAVSDTGPFTAGNLVESVGATLPDGSYEVSLDAMGFAFGYEDVKVYFYDATAMYVAEGYDNIMFTNLTEQQVWDLSNPVARGSTTVDAVLTKNAVSGVVTDEAGVPLEGIQVLVRAVSDTGPFTAGNLVESVGATLPDGSYEVSLDAMGFAFGYEDVKVYFYDATAMYVAEGYDNIMFTNLTEQQVWDLSNPVARGSTTVDAVLTKNAVSGVVTDEAGVPLEGIQVLVRAVSDTGPFTAGNLVESVGATLPDGSYEVSLDAMGFAFGYEDVKVYFYDATAMYVAEGYDNIMFTNLTEQQVWDLSIPVARGSTDVNAVLTKNAVSGVVTDEAGVPLEGIQVLVRAVSDTGPFTAGNLVESVGATLPDGSYEVSLDAMGFAFGYEDVKVYFYDATAMYVAEGYDNIMFTNLTEQQVWDLSNPVARGSTEVNAVLALQNEPPVISVAHSLISINEGEAAFNSGTIDDPDGDPVNLSATIGFITNNNDGTWTWSFSSTDGPSESQTVAITADDGNEGITEEVFTLVVNNVAPTIESIIVPPDPVSLTNQPVIISSTFSDPAGIADEPYTCLYNFGDDTGDQPGVVTYPNSSSPAHNYQIPGVYLVTVTITDKDGGSVTQESSSYVVIYDPEGGFVTGGGWIYSPEGASVQYPDATGKANFGFVSKYKKGATIPTGNTEFQFKAGDLNFNSSLYDWLVIAGSKAMFKGEGTINGAGFYGFMISAVDGDLKQNGGEDMFRIKIWDKLAGDAVVYDNQIGDLDDADPTAVLGGGSIVIHDGHSKKGATVMKEIGESEIKIYPNPFDDYIHVELMSDNSHQIIIDLIDMNGKVIEHLYYGNMIAEFDHQFEFNIKADLTAGSYILRIRTENGEYLGREIIIKR